MGVIDTSGYDPLLLERAKKIRLLALDVDGVLTDGRLYFDNQGNELKSFSTRDGLGMRLLDDSGIDNDVKVYDRVGHSFLNEWSGGPLARPLALV